MALNLEQIQHAELVVMDEIDRVCREQGIQYFLGYGSLIGAVRHDGFIPWDDDMDVMMFRKDYERFYEVFNEVRSDSRFRLVSARDKTAPFPFFKVVDDTTHIRQTYLDPKYDSGVWVDIFPIDACNPVEDAAVYKKIMNLSKRRYLLVSDVHSGSSPAIRLLKRIVQMFIPGDYAFKYSCKMDELSQMCDNKNPDDMVTDIVGEIDKEKYYRAEWFKPVDHVFEGRQYAIPSGYDECLTTFYGDWRTLPPEDERVSHSGIK